MNVRTCIVKLRAGASYSCLFNVGTYRREKSSVHQLNKRSIPVFRLIHKGAGHILFDVIHFFIHPSIFLAYNLSVYLHLFMYLDIIQISDVILLPTL